MAECQKVSMAKGESYPRTCPVCGLGGPCKYAFPSDYRPTLGDDPLGAGDDMATLGVDPAQEDGAADDMGVSAQFVDECGNEVSHGVKRLRASGKIEIRIAGPTAVQMIMITDREARLLADAIDFLLRAP